MSSHNTQYRACRLCPRRCGVDRTGGDLGYCREGSTLRLAFAGIHRGEEPPISITDEPFSGSGTIFVTGCPLGCSFCQNCQLSGSARSRMGREVAMEEFAAISLLLQQRGAANINIVTGTHFIPSLASGLELARRRGLRIPIVWNTSSFETLEALEHIAPHVDIFLADFKWSSDTESLRYCGTGSYPAAAREAIRKMAALRPLSYDGELLRGGTIVRHLVMPGHLKESIRTLTWYAEHLKESTLLSLMVQFVDTHRTGGDAEPSISRNSYNYLLQLLDDLGIDDGFIQEPEVNIHTDWVPDFLRRNPFPESFCDPVWHWKYGFLE